MRGGRRRAFVERWCRLTDDVVILGGGHNALVAGTYLARAGLRVRVFEARDAFGGAAVSARVFRGVDARVSRFAYLVSLLPAALIDDLELGVELRPRRVASYTPVGDGGLLVAPADARTAADRRWRAWEERLRGLAEAVGPTLTDALPRAAAVAAGVEPDLWTGLTTRPLGALVESAFPDPIADDAVRGVVLTDALIGTDTYAWDPSLRQNCCFLYHVIGGGTGEWKVPVGGMGAVSDALVRAARRARAVLETGADVVRVSPLPGGGGRVTLADERVVEARYVIAGCAPATLSGLLGEPAASPEGCQLKVNLLVRRLPRLRSGLDPETAFAGTMHLAQGYGRLAEAYEESRAGRIPDPLPCEVYCHTLTDPSILAPELAAAGWHTLTIFGLCTPARLFRHDPDRARDIAGRAALRSLQAVLAEPLQDCLAVDGHGVPCVEVMTPLHVEAELRMPGGHIFHGDLSWPWLEDSAPGPVSAAEAWGVATPYEGVLLGGAGSVRGGAVSGIGGHNAAMAVLSTVDAR